MSEIQAKNSFGEIHLSQGIDWAFHSLSHYPLLVYNLDNFPLHIFNNFHHFPTSNGRLACEEIMQAPFSFRLVNKKRRTRRATWKIGPDLSSLLVDNRLSEKLRETFWKISSNLWKALDGERWESALFTGGWSREFVFAFFYSFRTLRKH